MIHNTVEIKIDYNKLGIQHVGKPATITTYIKDIYDQVQNPFHRPLVVICPGGGYEHLSPREGEAVALKMLDLGYNAVILRYSLMPNEFPCALYEAAYTMKYVRDHADEWDVNPDKIIIAGFSAGGHLAASVGTMWNSSELNEFLQKELKVSPEVIKPNAMLLGYPVITSGEYAHRASFKNLLGSKYDAMVEKVALENRVTKDTPNAFIWHTFADGSVPMENSLLFANALKKADIKFELHIFPDGAHGLGLGTAETDTKDGTHNVPAVAVWPNLFQTWVKNILE